MRYRTKLVSLAAAFFLILLPATSIINARIQQPTDASEDRLRGIQLYKKGDSKAAIVQLRVSLQKNKKDSELWYYLGLALTREGQYKEAGKAYETAVKLQANFAHAYAGLAFTLLLRNKLKEAESSGLRALELDSSFADAHYIVGVVRLRSGDASHALDHAQAAIRLNPNYARGYLLESQALVGLSGGAEVYSQDFSEKQLANYKDAARSLEKYLNLNNDKANDSSWREQLEALNSYIELIEKHGKTVFTSKEISEMARVVSKPEPSYTEEARRNQVNGTVVLRAVFAADSQVKNIMVIKGLPDGLTERAIAAARRIKFIPAMKDGKPVSMWMQLEYNFNLY